MKGLRIKLLIALGITSSIFFFHASSSVQIEESNRILFKNGDIILSNGRSFKSSLVRLFDLSSNSYSHAGIIEINSKQVFVVHSTPDGEGIVKRESLENFLANSSASNWAVYRMKGLEANLLDAVMKAADCFLETKTPFDLDFDLDSDDKLYCTELIVECFRSVGKNPFPDKTGKDIIFPSMFCSNQDFFEVYNSKAQRGKKK